MKDESRKAAIRKVMRIKALSKKQATALVDNALREIQNKLDANQPRQVIHQAVMAGGSRMFRVQ